MKIALYTCMFGNYDALPVHKLIPEFDYIKMTDGHDQSAAAASRFYKMLPHRFLDRYDISVYADSNMDLMLPEELLKLCQTLYDSKESAILFKHPQRVTIYGEILACIRQGVGTGKLLEWYNKKRKEGFKDDFGLTENNVLIRKHNDETLSKCSELWWEEYSNGCTRDQVCFPYARWKSNYANFILLEQKVKEDIFKWRPHGC